MYERETNNNDLGKQIETKFRYPRQGLGFRSAWGAKNNSICVEVTIPEPNQI